ncbi:MAG: mitochondrial fission ELM1 family protein [Luteimonas sp.]|nr:mitochondrial fission ELM1 family protein [Luteimonas sp.]
MVTYVERTGSDDIDSARIWAVSDGRAGNARQAEALAGAIANGAPVRHVLLSPRAPWRWAAPRRLPGSLTAFGAVFAAAMTTPPDIVVGCGRQAALATRLLRDQGAKTIQILDPRIDPSHWDLVVVPGHDALRGDNVVTALGGLHPVDDDWLAHARAGFPALGTLPAPRTALLLGGGSRHVSFDAAEFERIADMLDAVNAREGGSVLATTSRRSSDALRAALKRRYGHAPHVAWCGPDDGDNPYAGLLAWADRIVCSPDSVNMVSEACATHVPVFVAVPDSTQGGPRRFLDALLARGRIRAMDGMLAPFDVEPLRETARIAATVRERLGI